ncbi:MAG: hypothetical protein ACHQ1D_01010 [Nitrososphaerales archaeon]
MIKEDYGPEDNWKFHPLTGQPIQRGLHNWKMLFKKPSLTDWITLFLMIIVIIGAFVYASETKACRETLANLDNICEDLMKEKFDIPDEVRPELTPKSSIENISPSLYR